MAKPGSSSPESGMAIMVVAMALVPIGDTLSKLLTDQLAPVEIGFWRFAFQSAILFAACLIWRKRVRGAPMGLMVLGGLAVAVTLTALIGAFAMMPLATAIAIFFIEPLVLTVMSALILREPTGWRRYLAVAVGLVGAIIVIRPSWSAFGWSALLPLIAAVGYASVAIVMRKSAPMISSVAMQFWFALIAAGALLIVQALGGTMTLVTRDAGVALDGPWGLLALMALLAALSFFLITEAFRRTAAGTLAPFQYLEIVGATLLGFLVFGELPDFWTWIGTAIILASGFYVFHRERKQARDALAFD